MTGSSSSPLPTLPLGDWKETYDTLHLWTQVVGKIKTKLHPPINHWWHSALLVSPRGLETGPIPQGGREFGIRFDFIDHVLRVDSSDGTTRAMSLAPKSVAAFYGELLELLASIGVAVKINPLPQEIPGPVVPLDRDQTHASYDRAAVETLHQILLRADRLLKIYRGGFVGKSSPSLFYWGSFDLAVTRFSGRKAPPRPGADAITREGYSHENISVGFWPGSGNIEGPAFYGYAAPEPAGLSAARIEPTQAFYNPPTHGFVLMLDDLSESSDPDRDVLSFFNSVYESAATLGNWDRGALERRAPTLQAARRTG